MYTSINLCVAFRKFAVIWSIYNIYNFIHQTFKGCLPQILLGPFSTGFIKVALKGWKCKFYDISPDNLLGFTSSTLTKTISFSSLAERTTTIYPYQTRTFGCPLGTNIVIKNATFGYNKCYLPINKTIARIKLNCNDEQCTDIRGTNDFFNTTLPCEKMRSFSFWRARLTVKYTCVPGKFRSCSSEVFLRKGVQKICRTPTPKCDVNKVVTLLKSHFDMGVLLYICYIFWEQLFLKTLLEGYFCKFSDEVSINTHHLNSCIFFVNWSSWIEFGKPRKHSLIKSSMHVVFAKTKENMAW